MTNDQLAGVPVLATRGDEMYLEGEHTAEQLAAAKHVGYRNYFRLGVFEAAEIVRKACPAGWWAVVVMGAMTVRAGAVRVGQVKVRSGDPSHPLVIVPIAAK